ncbi:Sec-independent periplasmic protein translocator TatC [Alcanivorax jadensis T9]|jgi:sec-independent protein translocase protein TatC|uniref:Sec-independent protein translocase protein TatC n=1 Tax=Alcanivorax jadensis T9 TaxID=1177181 RepID=A0ABR4WG42_9GAMM|nr:MULTISPECIES: twin-arginine translocase subunit TatC [Alcanivorax]KGD62425.1 Sec-independent periplasmic protein translocator TatC [Alcanivorax jadensis T9]MAC14876.1 twin-arginine translocase subunit TatC [Alcanivorax sp.]MBG31716.1 twin-arginine translocase subunit TatC [Alcanivorax sp.]MBP23589.1 twin-arginine translocase subunit TatC [Alcanivorax sp.]MDF1637946.1 twin-arginine translocase subunit TatC [Alcanivorax jadensis]|tara:strand:+ start:2891 stop:3649 length:759 start_codon:yes stop_codon:yes gene_type:complete
MNDASNDSGQPLIAHLLELRNRLLKAMAAISVVFLGLFYFSRELYTLVAKPLMQAMPEGTSMIATGVASPFLAPFKLTLYLSIFVAMPFILHQAWAFVAPGLYRHEKRLAIPLLGSSVLLFYAGAAFAYFVVFPLMFQFFTAIAPEGVAVTTDISSYLDFVLALFLAFGLAFELPIAIVLLVSTGATTVEKLASARAYVVVGCFVVGMLLTPPDIISQTLLALPMWFLFEVGLMAARLIRREKQKQQETPDP